MPRKLTDKQKVDALKSSTPCAECGQTFPPECMDFDHISGRKRGNVSTMVRKLKPWEMIEAEIAKCEIVCANCHRTRTKNRMKAKYRLRRKRNGS